MDALLPAHSAPNVKKSLLIGAVLCGALALGIEYRRATAIYDAAQVYLGDPDDYMRLYRVREVVSGSQFLVRRIDRINYPRGAELHWTAPFDYLLAIPAIL